MSHFAWLRFLSVVCISICISAQVAWGQTTIFNESFDDRSQFAVTQGAIGTDGSTNYFTITDESSPSIDKDYSENHGPFLAGQDTDDPDIGSTPSAPVQVAWTGIDIAGESGLSFTGKFAEVLDGSGDIDDDDFLLVEYRMDGGAWQNLIAFENDGTSSNTTFLEDTDFDGVGDGTEISSPAGTLVAFTKSVAGTGNTLDLRFTAHVNSGDEDFAIDDFSIASSPTVQFTAGKGSAGEEEESTVLTVKISNPDGHPVDVEVAFDGTNSTAGTGDFASPFPSATAATTVSFPSSASDGDTQTVALDIADDGAVNEGGETARFLLQNLNTSGTTAIGSSSQFDLTIRDAVSDHAGPIVITEIMPDPAAVSDGNGEYIELYNVNPFPIDIGGWKLSDSAINEATISPGVTVPARGFVVLCIDGDPAQNGGIRNCADDYANGLGLNNGGDTVLLTNDSDVIVDRVDYTGTDPWPDPSGAALVFTGTTDNNTGSNWTTATRRERGYAQNQSGDLGSPGRNGTGQTLQPSTEITGAAGWRMLAAPVSGITPAHLAGVSLVQGVSGLDFSGASPNLYQWPGGPDATVDWSVPSSADDLTSGSGGFVWYVFDTVQSAVTDTPPFTIGLPGVPRTTDVVTSSALGDGFHLLGNPFAQSFDVSGLNLSGQGFQTTVQVWDPSAGSYQNVTETVSVDDVIGPYQSFFVERTSGASATLTFSASGRRADPIPVKSMEEGPARIAFRLSGQDREGRILTHDEALTLTARPDASTGWDVHDASKLTPLSGRYATAAFRGTRNGGPWLQAVASVPSPLPEGGIELPVVLTMQGTAAVDTFTLAWPTWKHVPEGWTLALHDAVADATVDLRAQSSYTFTLPSAKAQSVPPPRSPMQLPSSLRAKADSDSARFVLRVQANPLPVELAGFNATVAGDAAQLAWATASETNNAGFHVEHRTPGAAAFVPLGFVEGHGTTRVPQQYRFRTDALEAGRHTFRLRQVDVDGTAAYSDTVAVRVRLSRAVKVGIAPNPVQHDATVTVRVRTEQNVSVALYDVLGRRVRTLHRGLMRPGRAHTLQLDTGGLASGLYLLRAAGEQFRATRRITVIR